MLTTRGYVASYKGSGVYVIPEAEYEMKNPNLIYVIYRTGAEKHLMVQNNRIVGTMDEDGSFVVWDSVGTPDFALAGLYTDVTTRNKVYNLINNDLSK